MRLPGDIRTAPEFWDMLTEKRTGHCSVPESRYNASAFYNPNRPRDIRTTSGYFLQENPAYFDANFFSIPPAEAFRLDPQQRLLLEVVWECLENAEETNWRGEHIGCFVGTFGEDWTSLPAKDYQDIDRYYALATGSFALSNRVSYQYDFKRPRQVLILPLSEP